MAAWTLTGRDAVTGRRPRHYPAVILVFKLLAFSTITRLECKLAARAGIRQSHAKVEFNQPEFAVGNLVGIKCLVDSKLALVAVATVSLQAFFRPRLCLEAERIEAEATGFIELVDEGDFDPGLSQYGRCYCQAYKQWPAFIE